ncbi:MAG: DNA mismatch repair endonuclease MutL [Proteobacteria bacterium]|nr:DNA mismatch repair endonuclease MutL [Pseudomonadota bacterium]
MSGENTPESEGRARRRQARAEPPRATGGRGRIRLLPDALVDQIAAGEVVERPASVVKELIENAVDAGATRLRVEVRGGGIDWIAVGDDGWGMSPEQARLCLQRHATSKIQSSEDLARIASFGFRGEALPSIASVSRLRLVTRERGAAEAFEVRVDAGRIESARPCGGAIAAGTRVEVADLFAAVPARRKFLKRPATEWSHVAGWLTRCALALPEIAFEVQRDDRPALVWPATDDPLDRIAAVLSEDEAAALVRIERRYEREGGGAALEGFVSSPERTRPNTGGIHIFVGGRPVRDRLLRHALLEVYRDLLPRGRFPTALLFLEIPPGEVDVNVHPAKWEVRFSDPQAIHQLVRRGVREAIEARRWLGAGGAAAAGAMGRAPADRVADRAAGAETTDWIFARPIVSAERSEEAPAGEPEHDRRLRFGELRLVGQLLASYLLVEGKDGLLLVDQHAAHERVLYERLRAEWLDRGVERQGLLAPSPVELEPESVAVLDRERERVSRLGFDVEPFGETSVVLRAIPALLAGREPRALLRDLARELGAGGDGDGGADGAGEVRLLAAADRVFASLACHSARRAGDSLEPREQQGILDALDAIPWAPTCPHGRPVAVAIELGEIERRFGRR